MRLLPLVLLTMNGCMLLDPVLYPEDAKERRAYSKEYDLYGEHGKQHGYTPIRHIKVYFPRWLDVQDRPLVARMVESYVDEMIEAYPKAGIYDWAKMWVYIHDAVSEKIVRGGLGEPIWCYGWRYGKVIYCPWRPILNEKGERIATAETDCLMVMPHEATHILSEWEGAADPNHSGYFLRPEIQNMIKKARENVISCPISQKSKDASLLGTYVPWTTPR